MRKTGVLLIHGLMGSPREYDLLECVLGERGYATRCVTLPGHGENPARRFFEVSAHDIADYCRAEYDVLAETAEDIYILGHSLGGICTLLMAATQPPGLKGAISLAAPCEYAYFFNHIGGLLKMPFNHLITGIRFYPEVYTGLTRPQYKFWMMPKLLWETRTMFRLLEEHLPRIQVPLCLAHSPYDLTIPYSEMAKIALRVGRPDWVVTHTLQACGHQIFPQSRERENVVQIILDFIEAQSPQLWRRSLQPVLSENTEKHPAL